MVLAATGYGVKYDPLFTNQRTLDSGMAAAFADYIGSAAKSSPFASFSDARYNTPISNDVASVGRFAQDATGTFGNRFSLDGGITSSDRFVDPFAGYGAFGQQPGVGAQIGITGGMAGQTGYAALDAHNNEFNTAAAQFGAPANLLKAMVNRESSGDWNRDGWRVTYLPERNDLILPFVGITKAAADAWGLDWNSMVGNKQAQINGMAKILSGLAGQYGGYDNAIKVYFGGEAALRGNWNDENGLGSNYYYQQASSMWHQFDQMSGGGSASVGQFGDGGSGSNIVSQALQFVGVPYVWGSLPSAGDDPWKTGWDCSAFVNYLDDKYGSNELPAGSHYQYQDTINKGLLVSDPNQLRAGDLVFFDTGNTAGGGANMNRAGHVGMYIGNGQFIQAANPGAGTIVSSLSDYMGMYTFLGGRRMSWSGGSGAGVGGQFAKSGGYNGSGAGFSDYMRRYLFKQAA